MNKEELNTLDELSVNGTGKIFTDKQPQITFANLNPRNQKVIIWGYELCNGAEWKDFLEVVNKLGKEKTHLEVKLAESEHRNEQLVDALNGEVFINYKLPIENAQLKQQLAEKDKEIYAKNSEINKLKCDFECFERFVTQNDALVINANQDKISFCIEQLENVKIRIQEDFDYDDLMYWLNKQINQLKGE